MDSYAQWKRPHTWRWEAGRYWSDNHEQMQHFIRLINTQRDPTNYFSVQPKSDDPCETFSMKNLLWVSPQTHTYVIHTYVCTKNKYAHTHTNDILNISNATTECITRQWVYGKVILTIYTNVTVNIHIW